MYISLIAMLKAWSNVLTKPGERTFATERSKASATLKTALVWILLAGLMISLLDIMRTALSEMWVLPPDELEWPSLPSNFTIFLDQYIGNLSIRILNLNFEFAKMYGWLWIYTGLFDLTANSVYRIANYIVLEIPSWIRDIAKGLLQPVSLLIKVGMYHCVATLLGWARAVRSLCLPSRGNRRTNIHSVCASRFSTPGRRWNCGYLAGLLIYGRSNLVLQATVSRYFFHLLHRAGVLACLVLLRNES